MKEAKSAAGRINGGPDRRASYPGDQWVKQANSATKVWVKVAMGITYFLCVSVAAFVLAIYYGIFWKPDGSVSNSTQTGQTGNNTNSSSRGFDTALTSTNSCSRG